MVWRMSVGFRYIGRKEGLPADKKTLQRPQGLSWPVVDVKKTMFVKEVQRRPQVKWLGAKPKEDDDDATGTYIAAPIHSLGAFIVPSSVNPEPCFLRGLGRILNTQSTPPMIALTC
jgi:hypothetical protein